MDTIAYPDREQSPKEWLSVADSMPEWLVAQWIESYGLTQTTQICESFFAPSQTTIRVNEMLTSKEELVQRLRTQQICVEEVPQMPEALYISGYDSLESIPEFAEGFFYVQDLSSMQIADVLAPKEGEFILDVCAAPGGKATHAALRMKNTGTVLARDISEEKTALIRDNIRKLRLSNCKAECFDACVLDDAMIEHADAVIADLPCSGFGVIAKKPDIKYHTSLEDVKALAALQRQMLHVVCRYVRPGGRLVYSTCTISREENEENTAWFLKEHPEFCLEAEQQIFPENGKWDGFYYALLKKS
jgi:16S rRNA (cytosine967-C5)-methyltransferase